jgi:hypothetical protein
MLAMFGKRDSTAVLYVANSDGSGLHEVATAPARQVEGSQETTFLAFPHFDQAWAADDRIAFVTGDNTTLRSSKPTVPIGERFSRAVSTRETLIGLLATLLSRSQAEKGTSTR